MDALCCFLANIACSDKSVDKGTEDASNPKLAHTSLLHETGQTYTLPIRTHRSSHPCCMLYHYVLYPVTGST